MSGWKEFTLNEIADFPPVVKLYRGYEYSFIKMEDISVGQRFVLPEEKRRYGNSSCSKFGNDDILFARITPCLENGKIAQVKLRKNNSGFGSTEFFVFRGKKEKLNQSFLYYLAKSDLIWKSAVNSMVGASGRQRADSGFLGNLRFRIPLLPIQRKIAAVLSAYDDLIENNNRRIAILENMAAELYREWFVRLRFPGHDSVGAGLKPAPSKGVPEGWEVKKLSDVVELAYGKALKEEDRVDGPYPVYGSSGIVGFHNHALVKGPGIIVGRKGNVGSVIWSSLDFFPIDTTYYVKSKFPFEYVYYLIQSMNFINNDAAVPGLNREQAYANKFYFPPLSLIDSFAAMAKPFFTQKNSLKKQNEFLEISRDRLLSRLMSGKIDVENLDIQFPDSMKEEAVANA